MIPDTNPQSTERIVYLERVHPCHHVHLELETVSLFSLVSLDPDAPTRKLFPVPCRLFKACRMLYLN